MAIDYGPAEKVALGKEEMQGLEGMCLCPSCPAYPAEDVGEKQLYCLRGKSDHADEIDPSECLCEDCEVYKGGRMYGANFFCITGAELAKGLKHVLEGKPVTDLVHQKRDPGPVVAVTTGLDVHKREKPGR